MTAVKSGSQCHSSTMTITKGGRNEQGYSERMETLRFRVLSHAYRIGNLFLLENAWSWELCLYGLAHTNFLCISGTKFLKKGYDRHNYFTTPEYIYHTVNEHSPSMILMRYSGCEARPRSVPIAAIWSSTSSEQAREMSGTRPPAHTHTAGEHNNEVMTICGWNQQVCESVQ